MPSGPNTDALQVIKALQDDSGKASFLLDEKAPDAAQGGEPDTAFSMLKKLESTVGQNLSVVAVELQEIHRNSSEALTKIQTLETKLNSLSQKVLCAEVPSSVLQSSDTADQIQHIDFKLNTIKQKLISPEELQGLQQSIESDLAALNSDQTYAVTSQITKHIDAAFLAFRESLLDGISGMTKPLISSTPILRDRDYDSREGSSGSSRPRAHDAAVFCHMCNDYGKVF